MSDPFKPHKKFKTEAEIKDALAHALEVLELPPMVDDEIEDKAKEIGNFIVEKLTDEFSKEDPKTGVIGIDLPTLAAVTLASWNVTDFFKEEMSKKVADFIQAAAAIKLLKGLKEATKDGDDS